MDKIFYITSRHGDCGSNVVFHKKNGCGYGTNLDELELFTLESAQKELDCDINSLPLLASEVNKLSIRAVDCQGLRGEPCTTDPKNEYVVQIEDHWNGNDIAFFVSGGMTFNYDEAEVMDLNTAAFMSGKVWPKSYLDTLCRRTFQRENIGARKMITSAGIKYKKPRKQRPTTGKVRWNCPSCGKINWQFNPYDFDGCMDSMCDA